MGITAPVASNSVDLSTANCLRKFSIHFRREYLDLKPTKYEGEFGFDWLRDEFIFPMLKDNYGNYREILKNVDKSSIEKLKEVYKKDIKKITPFGEEYIPSSLSIFSENFINKKKYTQISFEVNLNLEIHQFNGDESPLDFNDDTIIEFVSNNSNLLISFNNNSEYKQTAVCGLVDLIGSGQKSKKLSVASNKSRKYYEVKNAIFIKSAKNGFGSDSFINIYAKKNGKKEEVGILLVRNNMKIKKAKFKLIGVVGNSEPIITIPDLPKTLEEQSLNQALIEVEMAPLEKFDLIELSKTDNEAKIFVDDFYKGGVVNSQGVQCIDSEKTDEFISRLTTLYEKEKKLPYKINSDANDTTYIFCTNITMQTYDDSGLEVGEVMGSATFEHEQGYKDEQWGNILVMFKAGLEDKTTFLHEIGHTFKLSHTFEAGEKFEFLHGYTDNLMDYDFTLPNEESGSDDSSPYKNNQFSLYRWQWDIMNTDRSAK